MEETQNIQKQKNEMINNLLFSHKNTNYSL